MKTLQQIIDRQDYARLNKALLNRAFEIAEKLRNKFEELCEVWDARKDSAPEYAVQVGDNWYCSRYNLYTYNGRCDTDGTTFCVYDRHTRNWWPLEFQPHAVYAKNTPNDVFVKFLNDANTIVQKLDEIESELVAESTKAIESVKAL